MVKTDHFILRYTNCWEDADILTRRATENHSKNILSICSGGDNSLSLLTCNPDNIVVADINPKQLYLMELKMAAIQCLSHGECLKFLGFYDASDRIDTFGKLKHVLSAEALEYWKANSKYISEGVIYAGRLEKNLRFFAKFYRPLIHSGQNVNQLLSAKNADDQKSTYERVWNTKWWRFLFRIFFSNTVLRFIAPDPDFFTYIDENVGKYLLKKTAAHFSDPACQQNPFLHYAMKGHFKDCLPHAWMAENFKSIKTQLHKIKLHCGFAEEAAAIHGHFDFFNLSNIFEYTTPEEFSQIGLSLHQCATPNAKMMYWNILLPRKLSDALPSDFISHSCIVNDTKDCGWIYFRCITDTVVLPTKTIEKSQ